MSIAERLGYLSVVETLRPVTAVAVPAPLSTDEKYRVISPEIMQEAPMSDSEEEGGTDILYEPGTGAIDVRKRFFYVLRLL